MRNGRTHRVSGSVSTNAQGYSFSSSVDKEVADAQFSESEIRPNEAQKPKNIDRRRSGFRILEPTLVSAP